MKYYHIIILSIITIVLISACSNKQTEKLTANEIWDKYIEAIGKKEKLLNIKSFSYTSDTDSEYGIIKSKLTVKYPDKTYNEFTYPNGQIVTFIINGDKGIVKSQNGTEDLSTDFLIKTKDMGLIFSELHFKELGYDIKLIGEEKIGEDSCYNISIKTDYENYNYFINKTNFQILRHTYENSVYEIIETEIINGIRLVLKSKTISEEFTRTTIYSDYKWNFKIDDTLFDLEK